MSWLWLSCVALLLALPAIAQSASEPVTANPLATGLVPVQEMRVECTPASRASELIGNSGCVSGKVFRVTTRKNGSIHLALCPAHSKTKCSFQAVVKAGDRSKVGDLSYLQGKLVGVIGGVIEYRRHPEIVVKDRQQIRAAAGDPPIEFDAAQQKASSGGQTPRGSRHDRAW